MSERHIGTDDTPLSITVVILTHNEELHLPRALASVRPFAQSVLVVDSGSTDETVGMAERAGARVLHHKFLNYADQFQWALDHGGIDTAWTMRLDADEVIEPDLAAEMRRVLPTLGPDITGINFSRKHIFMDRWVRHGGRFPLVLLRLWRTGKGRIESRWMDEHIIVEEGRTIALKGGFADVNLKDITFFTAKHNGYAIREAIDVLNDRYHLVPMDRALSVKSASFQASIKRWVKEKVYNRLPLGAGPLIYFLYRYFFQLGFLDGRSGFIYHFLQGYWYRFLVDAKVYELERGLSGAVDDQDRLARLSRLTGHDVTAMAAQARAKS